MGKRLKRDDLENLRPVPCVYVAELSEDGPLHLIVEQGEQVFRTVGGKRVLMSHNNVTACKRVSRWPRGQKFIGYSRLCERCGTVADFEQAVEDWKFYIADLNHQRNQEKALKDAEFEAEMTWTKLGEQIEQRIMDDAQALVDNGFVLVPFNQNAMSQLRVILKRFVAGAEKNNPNLRNAQYLLEHLEDYK